ncbi:hypothetical protein [Nocardioides sp. W7]|uniref:hypothetical protein n=1 Tax=Nocardioides sp. W7 TaxID=2931390 RepID=UPI001FD12AD4|nr:hypothetical protein [Nocardioides sp. W7]
MTRTPKLIASAFLVLTLATACGGGDEGGDGKSSESKPESSGNRPSVDELSAAFLSGENMLGPGLKEDQADCVAEAFHDSDVSDEALQALVDKDEDFQGDEDDNQAMAAISQEWMKECMGVEAPSS